MKRVFCWIAFNSILATCVVLGIFFDIKWAENITIFIIWVVLFAWVTVLITPKERQRHFKQGRSVPKYIGISFDIILVLCLVGVGWIWTAVVHLISTLIEIDVHERKEGDNYGRGIER